MGDVYFSRKPKVVATTPLYPLPLLHAGTGAVESLHSYAYRLAFEHCIAPNTLFTEVLTQYVTSQAERNVLTGWHRTEGSAMVGLPHIARSFVDLLERTTGQKGLELGTMLPFSHLLHGQRGAAVQRFCPGCVREDVQAGQLPYERLLWRLSDVTRCPLHEARLQTVHCTARYQVNSSTATRVLHRGVCRWCGSVGFECNPKLAPEDESPNQEEVVTAKQTFDLIAAAPSVRTTSSAEVKMALLAHAAKPGGGLAGVAKRAGFGKTTIWHWTHDEAARTYLSTYEALSTSTGISLVGLMTADHSAGSRPISKTKRQAQTKRRVDAAQISQAMNSAMADVDGTVAAVEAELKVDHTTLKRYEPELYAKLALRSAERRKQETVTRHREAVDEAVRVLGHLTVEGETPTLRNAAEFSKTHWGPGDLKSAALLILRSRLHGAGPRSSREGLLGNAFRHEVDKAEVRLRAALAERRRAC